MQDWLSQRSHTTPNKKGVVDVASTTSYTFAELDTLVKQRSHALHAHGARHGSTVAVVTQTHFEAVLAMYAAVRIGCRVAVIDPDAPPATVSARLSAIEIDIVLCEQNTKVVINQALDHTEEQAIPSLVPLTEITDSGVTSNPPADPLPDEAVQFLLFTSGTTGNPKPVPLSGQQIETAALGSACRIGLDPSDRWMSVLSMHHMGGITPLLRFPIYGMTVILTESFDAELTPRVVDQYDVTAISLVPTMLKRILHTTESFGSSLRCVLLGGAPASIALLKRCQHSDLPVYPTYGMTETASQIATATPDVAFEDPETVGQPLVIHNLTIVGKDGNRCPHGDVGEIVVSGQAVIDEYYNVETGRWGEYGFHTGDIGRLEEDGRLVVVGRKEDRILTGGETVSAEEVSNTLELSDQVTQAAVVGVGDQTWGERICAVVVPPTEMNPSSCELMEFVENHLSGYKIPKEIKIQSSLPRTDSGTVDREALKKLFSS